MYGTNRYGWKSRGKGTPKRKKNETMCAVLPETSTLFQTKICDIPSQISELNQRFPNVKSFITFIVDVNECSNSPCKNGATCSNTHGSYKCTCDRRFTGKNCDQGLSFVWIIISHLKVPKLAFGRKTFSPIVKLWSRYLQETKSHSSRHRSLLVIPMN